MEYCSREIFDFTKSTGPPSKQSLRFPVLVVEAISSDDTHNISSSLNPTVPLFLLFLVPFGHLFLSYIRVLMRKMVPPNATITGTILVQYKQEAPRWFERAQVAKRSDYFKAMLDPRAQWQVIMIHHHYFLCIMELLTNSFRVQ